MSGVVIAVVVTYNRKALLRECLGSLLNQTYAPAEIIVIDNASSDGTRDMLEAEFAGRVSRIYMTHNVGGAGGFYRGMKAAYDNGADWLWLMDDDGLPRTDALAQMMAVDDLDSYGMLNSLIVHPDKTDKLSFGLPVNGRLVFPIKEIIAAQKGAPVVASQHGNFNGTLINRKTVDRIGYTRREMFVWGDEHEFADRVRAAGLKFGVVIASHHMHPVKPWASVKFGPFGALPLPPAYAANIFARNSGYRAARNSRYVYAIGKPTGYALYYLTKGEFKKAWNFMAYWIDGMLDSYRLTPSRESLLAKSEDYSYMPVRRVVNT